MTMPAKPKAVEEVNIVPTPPHTINPIGESSVEILAIPNTLVLNSSSGTSYKITVEIVLATANDAPIKKKTIHNNIGLITINKLI